MVEERPLFGTTLLERFSVVKSAEEVARTLETMAAFLEELACLVEEIGLSTLS